MTQNDTFLHPFWPPTFPLLSYGGSKKGVFSSLLTPVLDPPKTVQKSDYMPNTGPQGHFGKKGQKWGTPFLTENGRFLEENTPKWHILEVKGLKSIWRFDPKMAKDWPWPEIG